MKFPVSKLKKEEAIYLGDQYSPFFMSNHTRILFLSSCCALLVFRAQVGAEERTGEKNSIVVQDSRSVTSYV
jgi:hypothetical protein